MKNSIKRFFTLTLALLTFAALTSCQGKDEKELVISTEATTVAPGEVVEIQALYGEESITPTYTITAGQKYASISQNKLTVSNEARNEQEIVFYATYEGINSNQLHLEVVKEEKELVAEITATKLLPGGEATLSAKLNGATCTATFEFVGTVDFATITGDKLTIKDDAEIGSLAQIIAKSGEYTSTPIAINVVEDTSNILSLSLTKDSIKVDATTSRPQNNQLAFEVYDKDGNKLTDLAQFDNEVTVVDGNGIVDYTVNNGVITFSPKKHGTSLVTIKLTHNGETLTELLDVESIKVPETITLPNKFLSTRYTIGMYNTNKNLDAIEIVPEFTGINCCEDYNVTFTKDGEATTKASYNKEEKVAVFEEVGTYKITIETNTGAEIEKKVEKIITVNDGVNVRTYEEFKNVMCNIDTNDYVNKTVTTVNVLNDLVLDGKVYRNAVKIADSSIDAYGSFDIHGNGFKVDTTDVPIISQKERVEANIDGIDSFIEFHPYGEAALSEGKYWLVGNYGDFEVSVDELDIIGNISTKTTMQEILSLPADKTFEECMAYYSQLSQVEKEALLDNSYRYGIKVDCEEVYTELDGQRYSSHINAQCASFKLNDSYINGFSISCLGMDKVVDAQISNCIFEGSFASTVTAKGGKFLFTNVDFKQCGMISVEYDAIGEMFSDSLALPVLPYAKAYAVKRLGQGADQQTVMTEIASYMYEGEQGIKYVGCTFENWADGKSLNATFALNPNQYISTVFATARGNNGGNPTAFETATTKQVGDVNYFNLVQLSSATTYLLKANNYTKIEFQNNAEQSILGEVPANIPLEQITQQMIANAEVGGFNVLNEYFVYLGANK